MKPEIEVSFLDHFQDMAIIRHMALNLLQMRKDQMKRQSIKRLRKMAGWDDGMLSTILSHNFS